TVPRRPRARAALKARAPCRPATKAAGRNAQALVKAADRNAQALGPSAATLDSSMETVGIEGAAH
ncbi:MAG: hypothetical protein ACOY5G_06820, partial [Pseudomonadota bacterium]